MGLFSAERLFASSVFLLNAPTTVKGLGGLAAGRTETIPTQEPLPELDIAARRLLGALNEVVTAPYPGSPEEDAALPRFLKFTGCAVVSRGFGATPQSQAVLRDALVTVDTIVGVDALAHYLPDPDRASRVAAEITKVVSAPTIPTPLET